MFILSIDSFTHLATCPECRKGINVKKDIIPRLFFNQVDFDPGKIDPGKLKNNFDSVKLDLRQKEREKDELRKECRSKEVGSEYLYFSRALCYGKTIKASMSWLKFNQIEHNVIGDVVLLTIAKVVISSLIEKNKCFVAEKNH